MGLILPDGACRRGQRRAECPDVLFMLLHCGNADFEGGNVGHKRSGGQGGLLPLSVLLGLQERHELDLDYRTGKTKHTPGGAGRREGERETGEEAAGQKKRKTRDKKV